MYEREGLRFNTEHLYRYVCVSTSSERALSLSLSLSLFTKCPLSHSLCLTSMHSISLRKCCVKCWKQWLTLRKRHYETVIQNMRICAGYFSYLVSCVSKPSELPSSMPREKVKSHVCSTAGTISSGNFNLLWPKWCAVTLLSYKNITH